MGSLLGIFLHAVGGFAAGSFYIPLKKVKGWAWESGWLISGVAAWLVVPLLVALLTVPETFTVLANSLSDTSVAAGYTFLFGLLWGIGGLTYGLSLRYLGVALGSTVALGCCAAFGTLMPPLVEGRLVEAFSGRAGMMVLGGVLVCFSGIVMGGIAGRMREREQAEREKADTDFARGLVVAVLAGILSACFAFGLAAGDELASLAVARDTAPLFQNSTVLVVLLWGGFVTNAVYCLIQNRRNRSFGDYGRGGGGANYFWAASAGAVWYFQFMFYGMGSTFLGPEYDFASWTIHMAFIILFSNLWGIYFDEWAGTSRSTRGVLYATLGLLAVSVVMIGVGSNL